MTDYNDSTQAKTKPNSNDRATIELIFEMLDRLKQQIIACLDIKRDELKLENQLNKANWQLTIKSEPSSVDLRQ